VDADFAGNWDPKLTGINTDTAHSRHGFVVLLAGVPLLWKSTLQQEHTLSSMELELIGRSMVLKTTLQFCLWQGYKRWMSWVSPSETGTNASIANCLKTTMVLSF
jgi:hypothetical protein